MLLWYECYLIINTSAEGFVSYHDKVKLKYGVQARVSVTELLDHTIEAKNWNYIDGEEEQKIRIKIDSCLQLINGYIRYLRNKENEN